jgi:hypothetical protein
MRRGAQRAMRRAHNRRGCFWLVELSIALQRDCGRVNGRKVACKLHLI